jgi:hypothetical protein
VITRTLAGVAPAIGTIDGSFNAGTSWSAQISSFQHPRALGSDDAAGYRAPTQSPQV